MERMHCISCGHRIHKVAIDDPFMCRACELEHGIEMDRYKWLDAR